MVCSNAKAIGEVLRIVRKANDYTKKEAAQYAQISYSYMYAIESGEKILSLEYFKKLSNVYNLSASQMMELIEYYESLESSVESKLRKYQHTLIKVLNMYLNTN